MPVHFNALAIAARDNEHALRRLLEACAPLIAYQVSRIHYPCPLVQRDVLEQIATLAVWTSLRNWDPARGSFSAFAARIIRCRLLDALRHRWSLIIISTLRRPICSSATMRTVCSHRFLPRRSLRK
jgi:DNA-directed RNA polymerase specialized sigma subunit